MTKPVVKTAKTKCDVCGDKTTDTKWIARPKYGNVCRDCRILFAENGQLLD